MPQVLILGAGLSGLTAARQLKAAGVATTIVDKGRGIGGRMATRRIDNGVFDHGAQFFTARSDEFKALLQEWQENDVATEWFKGYPSPENEKPDDTYPRYRGVTGMTGIAKFLARDLDIHLDEQIERLSHENGRWTAHSKSGQSFEGDELLLTAPVPQSLTLLQTSAVQLPTEAKETLESLRYEPCIAVLFNLREPSRIPAPGALFLNDDRVSWIADNFQKGISPREGSVTVHSTAQFARERYDDTDLRIAGAIMASTSRYLGPVVSCQVRRWRYSKPENPLEIGALRVKELGLTFAGDIFQGAKVEGAVLSGLAAAQGILESKD